MLKRQHLERDHSARQLSDVAENVVSETYRLFRTGTRVELLKVAEVIKEIPINLSKTMGCIIERGADVPLISSISGWGSSAIYLGKVLDSSAWTEAVREFCKIIRHQLPKHYRDFDIDGKYQACHVEKRLRLFFICHFLSDGAMGYLDAKKLQDICKRNTPLKAILILDRAPCPDCEEFQKLLQTLNGILFNIEVCLVVLQTKRYKEDRRLELWLCRNNSEVPAVKTGRWGCKHGANKPKMMGRGSGSISEGVAPKTPPRPTRSSGLFTPPELPFSFAELDKLQLKKRKLSTVMRRPEPHMDTRLLNSPKTLTRPI